MYEKFQWDSLLLQHWESNIFLAEDLHSPDLEWFDNLSLAPRMASRFDLWDSGSGLSGRVLGLL